MIKERILSALTECNTAVPVSRSVLGIVYTCVQLENGSAGTAYSFPRQDCGIDSGVAMPIAGKKAEDLFGYLGGENLAASSLSLAAVNACIGGCDGAEDSTDILEEINILPNDRVCMIGCFHPVLRQLRERSIDVVTIEQNPVPGTEPPEKSDFHLGRSQVAIITATAIINNTIDRLLESARNCREVAVLGPSTPMLPNAFENTPVTLLSGIHVSEPEKVFSTISEGQGFKLFKQFVSKKSIRIA